MSNLLDSIKGYITPELVSQAASALGENESGISKAIGGLAPTILAGLLNKSGDANAMGAIFNLLSDSKNVSFLDNLGGLIGGGNLAQGDPKDIAGNLMGSLFGGKVPAILNSLSSFANVKSSTTSSLLGMVGPLIMGILSKKINTDGLNLSGFLNLLQGEKSSILGALPGGLSAVMGLASGMHKNTAATTDEVESTGGMRWLWPLLLLLGLAGGIIGYMKYCGTTPAPVATQTPAPAPVATAPAEPAKPAFSLPAGTKEAEMLAFIKNAESVIDKKVWFDFPEIMFDVNKATIKPESEVKLNAVLGILNEFPAVKLKVGGYTDADGNDQANLKLSAERARACVNWLIGKGISADRLVSEGYGEQHPVAPNDTPENKAQNRRISFNVTAK